MRRPTKSLWSKLIQGTGIFFLFPFAVLALDPAKGLLQFRCHSWLREDGLPANGINAIAQTHDGYLWVGTQMGFVRLDGLEFKAFNLPSRAEFRNQIISSLASSRNGGLWFGIRNGAFGFFDQKTGFAPVRHQPWIDPMMNVISLREATDGAVWVGSGKGVARFVPGKTNETQLFNDVVNVTALYEDSRQRIWVGTDGQGLHYWQDGKLVRFPDDAVNRLTVFAIAEDLSGRIWIGTPQGLRCFDSRFQPIEALTTYTEVKAMLVDRHGVLWIGTTGEGLVRYDDGKFSSIGKSDGLASDNVTALCEDHEGNLWIGTRNGLTQLADVKLPLFSATEGLSAGSYHDVCVAAGGGLWAGTSRGISRFNGTSATNYTMDAGLAMPYIKRVFEATNGDLYIVDGGKNVEILSDGKVVARYANTNWPTAFAEDAQGVVVAVGGELFRVSREQFGPYTYASSNSPPFYWIRNLSSCRDGSILVATVNGFFRLKNGSFDHWTVENGLSDFNVLWASEDAQGTVWAGLTTGICRLKNGRIQSVGASSGLFDNFINALVPDNRGGVWINSSRGIFRVSQQTLDDFFAGKRRNVDYTAYDGQEAVKTIDTTEVEYIGCKTSDGRVWFPTPQGLVMIDPSRLDTKSVAPPVHIERVTANGVEVTSPFRPTVLPGKGELGFQYSGVSFIAPQKMRFRYRLDGYEVDWVEAGGRRTAFYTNLKPGQYRFHVQACNSEGVWNTIGDSFAIELPPHFYQTTWAMILAIGLGVAGLFGCYAWLVRRLRQRQLKLQEANSALESRIRERTRELAEQRNLLRTLIDHLPDNVFVKDLESRVVIDNLAHARMFGVADPEQAIGKTDFESFPKEIAEKFFADEQKLLAKGGFYEAEERIPDAQTGAVRWLRTTKVPLRDSQGKIVGLAGIHRDITERKLMEEEVERTHKQLLQVSRKAGMAEVATSVLHNVGNVLNSVNVSTTLLADNIKQSKAANLSKVSAMFKENEVNLGTFLTTDRRGKQVPGYVHQLANFLAEEQKTNLEEIEAIRKHVEHIKEIVTMQQNYAKISGVTEKVRISELVEDALRINAGALVRHDVKVTTEYDSKLPEIIVDKHKVLQILVNLIRNAKYACDESGKKDKQMSVQVGNGENVVRVVVTDNGVGIRPENLTRIFNHGFTTRKHGHGFGLHSGALAAREMGGALTAHSEGPGLGATFVLQLPFQPAKVHLQATDGPEVHGGPTE